MDFDIAEFFIEVNYLRIGSKSSEVAIRVLSTIIFTARKRSLEGYVFTRVCLSTGGEYMGRYPPGQVHSPEQVHPPHPLGRYPPRQVHPRAGTTPPQQFMLGYGRKAGGTHPTGMHSCGVYSYLVSESIQNSR